MHGKKILRSILYFTTPVQQSFKMQYDLGIWYPRIKFTQRETTVRTNAQDPMSVTLLVWAATSLACVMTHHRLCDESFSHGIGTHMHSSARNTLEDADRSLGMEPTVRDCMNTSDGAATTASAGCLSDDIPGNVRWRADSSSSCNQVRHLLRSISSTGRGKPAARLGAKAGEASTAGTSLG